MRNAIRVDRPTLYRLAAESARDPGTVQRVLNGEGGAQSRAAVLAAAQRLQIPNVISLLSSEPAPTKIQGT